MLAEGAPKVEKLLLKSTIERRLTRLRDMTLYEGSYIPRTRSRDIQDRYEIFNDIDGRLETLIEDVYGMISDLSCAEGLNIIAKLSAISGICVIKSLN